MNALDRDATENAPLNIHSRLVLVHGAMQAEDRAHAFATIEAAMRQSASVTVARVDVFLNPRGVYTSSPEWQEHAIVVQYVNPDRAPFRIGAIQRTPGAESEFHS